MLAIQYNFCCWKSKFGAVETVDLEMKGNFWGKELQRRIYVFEMQTNHRRPNLKRIFKTLLLLCLIKTSLIYLLTGNNIKLPKMLSKDRMYSGYLDGSNQIHKPPLYSVDPRKYLTQHHKAFPRNYHFILDDTDVCRSNTPFLVLVVSVAPGNRKARDAIRKTWGTETLVQGELIQTVFLLGLPSGENITEQQEHVSMENLQYHDLIQSDFTDSYNNLTIKTMVTMDWLATRCSKVSYAMKIDSDVFINVENLVSLLKSPGIPKELYLTGSLMWDRPVVRDQSSPWYVPMEMYPDPHYPTYTLGMGYLFSIDLTSRFVEVSKSIEPFNIEDAYIGMCMKKLGLRPTEPPDPNQFRDFLDIYDRCTFSKIITYILGSSEQLVTLWTDLKKPGPPC
ncbi:beta-1,3-galactosyltransferase 1-like [Gadus macrocephalus]|uniref:beta-1,3-galactosyltransferase 1-like n=1 Tax=Gadus macrocephalus TaxID=80720 RepID=UPI0028CB9463|nr:beta-1,3-galactosyltransferase 1-like [Gadus macrocephalus]